MRKNKFNIISVISIVLTLTVLVACGGGGGSVAGGGIGGSGVVAAGSITQKGSIFVNGVEYETTSAGVTLNGTSQPDDSGLLRGMVVRVDGTRDTETTGTANTVIYEDVVKGPVTNIVTSTQTTTLTVLGQTVIVEQDVTYIDDNAGGTTLTLPTFNINDEIEVSGLRKTLAGGVAVSNGPIQATYIDIKETPLSEYEVKGVVENAGSTSFDISGLQVNFGTAQTNDTLVEVKAPAGNFSSLSDTLVAASVETRITGLGESEVDHAEVEGFINNLDTLAETFELDGQVIDYNTAIFEDGAIGDLSEGTKIEAEGTITGGILVADKIVFKEYIRVRGNALDSDLDGSFAIDGLSGLTIFIDPALTEYDGFSSVSAGDHIEIRGRQLNGSGAIFATEIKDRGVTDPLIEFQAPVTAFDPTLGNDNVTLMEIITIHTTDTTVLFSFSDFNDNSISRNIFYSNLATGDLVKAKGLLQTGSSIVWEEIEKEDE